MVLMFFDGLYSYLLFNQIFFHMLRLTTYKNVKSKAKFNTDWRRGTFRRKQ